MKKTLFLIFLFMISMTKVDAQTLDSIYVNGKTCQNDGTLESCLKSPGVEWNENTKTLTLNNYNGGAIQFHSSTDYASNNEEITLHLKGKNTITEKSGYTTLHWGDKLNGKITSDSGASLVINHERQSAASNTAVYSGGKLTITGGEITVNNNYTFDTDKDYDAIGIEARYGLFISGNTKIKINVNSDYYKSFGILVGGEGINNPEISIEKPASVEINLTAKNKLKLKDTATHPYGFITGTTGEIQYNITGTVIVNPLLKSIYVNGKTCQNDGTLESCLKSQGVEWNENTKTLTLNNYNGGAIQFHSSTDYASNNEEITLHLKGKNTITEKSGYNTLHWGRGDKLNGKITSDSGASLVINHERQSAANNTAVYSVGKLTITGGEITVNNNYTFDTDKDYDAIGIQANYGLFISGNAKIKINVNSDYYRSVGILVGGEGINNPEISIEKPASVEINLTAKNKLKLKDTATHPYLYVTGTTGEIIEKFIGYEDDLAIYAGASKDSAQKLVSIPDDFKDYAYLKITQEKSSVNTNDKTGDNVLSNPNTGRANVFIIIFVLIASFLITFMMYKKSVKNNT